MQKKKQKQCNGTAKEITFRVVPVENFREQRDVWKGSPVFPDGTFQTEIRVPLVQT